MSKKGKTPSLITGSAGSCKFAEAKRKRKCKRCEDEVPMGTKCVEVSIPGGLSGYRNYCTDCFEEILKQTEKDLSNLRTNLQSL